MATAYENEGIRSQHIDQTRQSKANVQRALNVLAQERLKLQARRSEIQSNDEGAFGGTDLADFDSLITDLRAEVTAGAAAW